MGRPPARCGRNSVCSRDSNKRRSDRSLCLCAFSGTVALPVDYVWSPCTRGSIILCSGNIALLEIATLVIPHQRRHHNSSERRFLLFDSCVCVRVRAEGLLQLNFSLVPRFLCLFFCIETIKVICCSVLIATTTYDPRPIDQSIVYIPNVLFKSTIMITPLLIFCWCLYFICASSTAVFLTLSLCDSIVSDNITYFKLKHCNARALNRIVLLNPF